HSKLLLNSAIRYCDDITWVKQTVNRRMAKGHGFYLQHAKETCLVGRKGKDPPGCKHSISSDVIFSERRGQSQKPEELYGMIEELVPNGNYLEIFGWDRLGFLSQAEPAPRADGSSQL
ncbi:12362_t:CDS:2, partial [Racocetra persica]